MPTTGSKQVIPYQSLTLDPDFPMRTLDPDFPLVNSLRHVSTCSDSHSWLSKEQLHLGTSCLAWEMKSTVTLDRHKAVLETCWQPMQQLCTFRPRIKIQWSVAPLSVIMQSALFSICINAFERKLRIGRESNLEEHVHRLCLPLARKELKMFKFDLKMSLNTRKKGN